MSILKLIQIYMGACGLAGASLGANMSAHGHFGGSSSVGTLIFGVIGGALVGSTFGSVVLPYVAYCRVFK